jgi:very-short-patch-repair endonuclease
MTGAEAILWRALRRSAIEGLHFRRQQVIGPYVADFYCETARLAIELDGIAHSMCAGRDRFRDAKITSSGIRILRFPNQAIFDDLDSVVAKIAACARKQIFKTRPNPCPLPAREGERLVERREATSNIRRGSRC